MKEINVEELKQIELNMLREIDYICREHDIKYYVIGGTLLGAVRHRGFIPWDDDIDIAMFENDYYRFKDAITTSSKYLRFDCLENSSNYPYPYGKVCRKDTRIKEMYLKGYECAGVFIDVFRIDGRGNNEQADLLYTKLNKFQECWLSTFSLSDEVSKNILKNTYRKIRRILRNRISTRKWAERIDSTSKYIKFDLKENEYCSWIHEKPFPSDIFQNVTYLEFEDVLVPCPGDYDKFLKIKYGDYMTLPPINERVSNHGFIAYKIGGGQ